MAFLSQVWGPPGNFARTRIGLAEAEAEAEGEAENGSEAGAHGRARWLPSRHRSILESVNGRRTPRDIAFVLGRGLYATMLDLIRMEALGLVEWDHRPAPLSRPSTAPRTAESNPSGASARLATTLPRRNPGGRRSGNGRDGSE